MTGYVSKKMLGAARLPDTPSARAYLDKILEDDDTQVYGDALTIAYQHGYFDGKKAAQPAQERTWVGLTEEERKGIWNVGEKKDQALRALLIQAIRDIETKLKERNT